MAGDTFAEVWGRVLDLGKSELDADAARALLRMKFKRRDVARIHELSSLANEGRLTPEERAELDGYLAIGSFLTILHSKARMALRGETAGPPRKARRRAS